MKKLAVLIFGIALIAGCADKQEGNEVVVSYKGGVLTKHDLIAHHNILKRDPQSRKNPELLGPEEILKHAINMEMIIQAGLKRKLHQDPYVRQELHKKMSDLFLKLMTKELVGQIGINKYTDEQIEAFYNENLNLYKVPALYSISLIKVAADNSEDIYQKIISGEIDFETAVATYSTDERSKANKGSIGIRSLNRFKPSWRNAIASLKQGEASKPILIDGEKYIFMLTNKTEEQLKELEANRAKVRNDMLYNDYRKAWENIYSDLRQEFSVEIDEKNKFLFMQEMAGQAK